MECLIELLYISLFGYLTGSIPSSIWLGRAFYGVDIRQCGSGNAGASNMFRVLGWKPALFVLVFDVSKGAVPTFYAGLFQSATLESVYLQMLAAAAAVLGHCYTCFARFRGGKGVATTLGAFIILFPMAVPVCLLVFFTTLAWTRYISLSSILATLLLPITQLVLVFGLHQQVPTPLFLPSFLLVPFILFTHRTNISRLIDGTETRIGSKKET